MKMDIGILHWAKVLIVNLVVNNVNNDYSVALVAQVGTIKIAMAGSQDFSINLFHNWYIVSI